MATKQSLVPFLIVAAVLFARRAGADEDSLVPVPNRPTASTTAESVAAGVFEVEGGVEAARDHENLGGLLKLGVFDRLELWLAPPLLLRAETGCVGAPTLGGPCTVEHTAGLGDMNAGLKLRFVNQKGNVPSIGVLYLVKIPTANAELGSGKVDESVTLLVSKDLGKVHVDANLGRDYVGRSAVSGFDQDFFGALAVSYPVSKRWGVSGEVSGFTSAEDGVPGTTSLLGAATFSPSPRLVLDAATSVSVHGDQPRVTVVAGLTYTVGRAFRR